MEGNSLLCALAILSCVFLGLASQLRSVSTRLPLPPGPPGRADVPSLKFWDTFRAWNRSYGPVVSFYMGLRLVIVLGTVDAAHDLLEKRGDIYSGRPRNIVGHEILSGGMRGIGTSYGPYYRRWKSLMQAGLSQKATINYRPLQSIESTFLMRDLLTSSGPLEYRDHLRRFVVSIIFCVAYGRRIKSLSDDVVVQNMKTDGYFGKTHVAKGSLVESWPPLLYLPHFLQWFRWEPERHRKLDTKFYLSLMNDVKRQLADNTAQPSMAAYSLTKQAEFGLSDVETAYALSAPWAAGVGTTTASIEVFLLAMLLFADVQKKAQAEIDSVVGHSRLPGFEDYDSLPYIQALLKEVTRWRCIAPTGFPHSAMADDTYQGMFIPKGATVYANIYAMTTDPEMFPNPDKFRPERFLDTTDPRLLKFNMPFGFGRRFCPGQNVALQTVFISIVRLLWTFDVLPASDNKGGIVIPSADDFTTGLITRPVPFPCRLELRNSSAAEVVHAEAERADTESASWK